MLSSLRNIYLFRRTHLIIQMMFHIHLVVLLSVTLMALPFCAATFVLTDIINNVNEIEKSVNTFQGEFTYHQTRTHNLAQFVDSWLEVMLGDMKKTQPQNEEITKLSNTLPDIKLNLNKEMDSLQNKEQANVDSLIAISNTIEALPNSFAEVVRTELTKLIPICDDRLTYKETDEKIVLLEQNLERIVNGATLKLNNIRNEIDNLKSSITKEEMQSACCDGEKNLIANKILMNFEGKLNRSKVYQVPDFGNILAGEHCRSRFANVLEKHDKGLKSIENSISSTRGIVADLVRKQDFAAFTNQTLDAVQGIHHNTKNDGFGKIGSKLDELAEQLDDSQKLLLNTSTEANKKKKNLYDDLSERNQQILSKMQEFSSKLLDFEDVIKSQGGDMYKTFKESFEEMKSSIIDDLVRQNSTLSSLGSTVQTETSKVWQHLAVSERLAAESKTALDTIHSKELCQ